MFLIEKRIELPHCSRYSLSVPSMYMFKQHNKCALLQSTYMSPRPRKPGRCQARRHPSKFPPRASGCAGWAGPLSLIANMLGVSQIPGVKQRSADCGRCPQRGKSQHHRPLWPCQGPERPQGGLSATPGLRLQAAPPALENVITPGSGLRVGVGDCWRFHRWRKCTA